MKKNILLIFSFILFYSCSINSSDNEIINEDKFIDVLVDIHLADATLVVKGLKINTDSTKIRLFYNDVLVKHNVTQKQIENTLLLYSEDPRDFEKIYEKVSEKIVKLEGEYEESIEKKDQMELK